MTSCVLTKSHPKSLELGISKLRSVLINMYYVSQYSVNNNRPKTSLAIR